MIFDKWKAITMQDLANEFMNITLRDKESGIPKEMYQEAFDGLSYNEDRQYKAYAIYDGEKVEDFTKLVQIGRGI